MINILIVSYIKNTKVYIFFVTIFYNMKFQTAKVIDLDKIEEDKPKHLFIEKFVKEMRLNGYDNYDDWLYITRRVREKLEIKVVKKHKKLPVYLNPSEVTRLLRISYKLQAEGKRKDTPKKGLIVETVLKSGMRNFEVCKLRIENIDFDSGVFKVEQGKGQKDRLGILAPSILNKLIVHCNGRKNGYVFLSNRGNKYTTRSIQYMIDDIRKEADIQKDFSLHTLRHTFATILLREGVDIRKIQELLGHSNLETTTIYTHIELEMLKEPIQQIMDNVGE